MLKADLVLLQVVKDEADHAHDLLFVGEVENLGDVLNDVQLEVLEEVQSEFVITEDPERAEDVVSNLSILLTLTDQELVED